MLSVAFGLFSILSCILLCFSGCGGSPFAPDFSPQRAFSLSMTAKINGKTFAGALTCDSYESLSLTFTDPPELTRFSVRTEEDGFVMDVGGSEDAVAAGQMNASAPLRLLFDAVKTAVFTNHGAFVRDRDGGVFTAGLTVNGVPVTVTFDEDGFLTDVTTDAFRAVFSR